MQIEVSEKEELVNTGWVLEESRNSSTQSRRLVETAEPSSVLLFSRRQVRPKRTVSSIAMTTSQVENSDADNVVI